MQFDTPYFGLDLSDEWTGGPGEDAEQWIFQAPARKAEVIVSVMGLDAAGLDLEPIGEKILEHRRRAEVECAPDRAVSLAEPWTSVAPDGRGRQLNFLGCDDQDRHFFYAGFLHDGGLLNVRGELLDADSAAIEDLFREVLSGLRL